MKDKSMLIVKSTLFLLGVFAYEYYRGRLELPSSSILWNIVIVSLLLLFTLFLTLYVVPKMNAYIARHPEQVVLKTESVIKIFAGAIIGIILAVILTIFIF